MWNYIYIRFYKEIKFILKVVLYILLIAMVAAMFTGCGIKEPKYNSFVIQKFDSNTKQEEYKDVRSPRIIDVEIKTVTDSCIFYIYTYDNGMKLNKGGCF